MKDNKIERSRILTEELQWASARQKGTTNCWNEMRNVETQCLWTPSTNLKNAERASSSRLNSHLEQKDDFIVYTKAAIASLGYFRPSQPGGQPLIIFEPRRRTTSLTPSRAPRPSEIFWQLNKLEAAIDLQAPETRTRTKNVGEVVGSSSYRSISSPHQCRNLRLSRHIPPPNLSRLKKVPHILICALIRSQKILSRIFYILQIKKLDYND